MTNSCTLKFKKEKYWSKYDDFHHHVVVFISGGQLPIACECFTITAKDTSFWDIVRHSFIMCLCLLCLRGVSIKDLCPFKYSLLMCHTRSKRSIGLFVLQNRPTGDCYVQLSTAEAAKEASETLHKKFMGTRYIEVFQVCVCVCVCVCVKGYVHFTQPPPT